jgi:hypothetical protein
VDITWRVSERRLAVIASATYRQNVGIVQWVRTTARLDLVSHLSELVCQRAGIEPAARPVLQAFSARFSPCSGESSTSWRVTVHAAAGIN